MNRKFVLLLLILTACSRSGEKINPVRKTIVETVYASGKIIAANEYTVFALSSGTIKEKLVHEGDTVSIGNITLTAHETPGHTPGCTSWTTTTKDGDATRSVIFFCSATVALNKLVTNPTYPGIIDDYKRTFAWSKNVHPDVLLAPHPEMYDMPGKRAKIVDGGLTHS